MKKSVKVLKKISIVLGTLAALIVLAVAGLLLYIGTTAGSLLYIETTAETDFLTDLLTVLSGVYIAAVGSLAVAVILGLIAAMWAVYGIVMLVKNQKHKNNIQIEVE